MNTAITAEYLATQTSGRWTSLPRIPITGFSVDSRVLRSGEVFIALKTPRRDGHDFIADARINGAAGAIVTRATTDTLPQLVVDDSLNALHRAAANWRLRFSGKVVGVTGSVGKTSTKEFLAHLLGSAAFVTDANLNNTLGVPMMLLRIQPSCHLFAVIEAGMSVPGELGISAHTIRPDIAIVTGVTAAHLEGVGSMANIAREKASLISELTPGGNAILPASLLAWPAFAAHSRRSIAVVFNDEPKPDITPSQIIHANIVTSKKNTHTLKLDDEVYQLGSMSDGLARNAALALAAARLLGFSASALADVANKWLPPLGRGSVHYDKTRAFYVDCYNSSPASLLDAAHAFDRLASHESTPRLFILGGMCELGSDSRRLHRACGAQLPLRMGDRVVVFGGDAVDFLNDVSVSGVHMTVASTVDELIDHISMHSGNVFLKGSRAFALERCLPFSIRKIVTFH